MCILKHRDLHWGQILVKDREVSEFDTTLEETNLADPRAAGVTVTIIDLGLARMDDAGDDTKQRWTDLDAEIFEGQGAGEKHPPSMSTDVLHTRRLPIRCLSDDEGS